VTSSYKWLPITVTVCHCKDWNS